MAQESTSQEEPGEKEPEALTWARVDFIRNRVQLVPRDQSGRRANIADILRLGDSLRTARASRAELRFNDGSLARVGERATFRFTPNTRNFQLSNGTILLLIPPGRGRSTIQTPNAVTGIQGSALFVRYIPETDTTIVGALTDNPDGPMVLFNRDGTEQQALRANEIGVIEGNQITELYQFDGTLFWQSSGLAEGFNYLSESTSTDELDGVRQEIREAISTQGRINGDSVITNPEAFKSPETGLEDSLDDIDGDLDDAEIEFEGSPAQNYESSVDPVDEKAIEVGVNNTLQSADEEEVAVNGPDTSAADEEVTADADADESNEDSDANIVDGGTVSSDAAESDGSQPSSDAAPPSTSSEDTSSEGPSSEVSVPAGDGVSQDPVDSDIDGSNPVDSGPVDSDPVDSGINDSGPVDSGPVDSGPVDSGLDDAGLDGAGLDGASLDGADVDGSDLNGVGDSSVPSVLDSGVDTPDAGASALPTGDVSDVTIGQPPSEIGNIGTDTTGGQPPVTVQTTVPTLSTPVDTVSVGADDITVPEVGGTSVSEVDNSLIDPVPDQVDNLDGGQVVHDLETHDPGSGVPSDTGLSGSSSGISSDTGLSGSSSSGRE